MNFRRSFKTARDRAERVPAYYKRLGLKLEASQPNYYRFSRGSVWFGQIARDIRGLPTKVEIIMTEAGGQDIEVLVLYDIDTMGKFVPISQRETIKEEMALLEIEVSKD